MMCVGCGTNTALLLSSHADQDRYRVFGRDKKGPCVLSVNLNSIF